MVTLVLPEGRAAFRFEPVGTKTLNKISEKTWQKPPSELEKKSYIDINYKYQFYSY